MNMKKIAAIGLSAVMAVTMFAACGSSSSSSSSASSAASSSAKASSDEKTLTMATSADFPPYEYMEGKEYKGIDIELAQAIADKLDMKLDIQNVNFDSIIAGVQGGKYDLGFSGITITDERKQSVAFSDPYITAVQSIIVPEGSSIKSKDDITKDTKIGVQSGTTGDTDASEKYGEDSVTRYTVATDAVQALLAGKVDCVIIDQAPAQEYVAANQGKLEVLPTEFETEEYAIAMNKKDTDLQEKVNKALSELKEDGTIDSIVAKYKDVDDSSSSSSSSNSSSSTSTSSSSNN